MFIKYTLTVSLVRENNHTFKSVFSQENNQNTYQNNHTSFKSLENPQNLWPHECKNQELKTLFWGHSVNKSHITCSRDIVHIRVCISKQKYFSYCPFFSSILQLEPVSHLNRMLIPFCQSFNVQSYGDVAFSSCQANVSEIFKLIGLVFGRGNPWISL